MKSNVSDYRELAEAVYIDATAKCTADVFDLRDLKTIRSRLEDESLSFLTITLPLFCSDLERALQRGVVDSMSFKRWKRVKGTVMPAFLQGITSQIFDFKTGKVITNEVPPLDGGFSDDIPTCIDSVRQICLTFKKLELTCTPKRVQESFDNFVEIEQSLLQLQVPTEEHARFCRVSSLLWDNMVVDFDTASITPKHGPGATAERISGNQKYRWQRWHDRLEPYFPLIGYGYPLGTPPDSTELENVTIVSEALEQPVRVIQVPKTLKGPRIIAIEPCCQQYAQQGIRDYLYDKLESYWLTRGHINFRDQRVNQSLALMASKSGQFATIDLSDASDRVPRSLAMEMFRANPDLRDSIEACRSTRAQLLDGRLVAPLAKFASMGSALCFPVEAMYFYTICVMALLEGMNLSPTYENVFTASRELYVYGDDIIVSTVHAVIVLEHLQKYNCKVNAKKTFISGSFKESCGMDAFAGYVVTPTYIGQPIPKNRQQVLRILSSVATANHFYLKGYWKTAELLFSKIEAIVGPLPNVPTNGTYLGRVSYLGCRSTGRWNYDLQHLEIRGLVPSPIEKTDLLGGYGALAKSLLSLEYKTLDWAYTPLAMSSELERSARRGDVALNRRWVSAS